MRMDFRDRQVWLEPGELIVVPHGVEHRPYAESEAHVMLVEPDATEKVFDEADMWRVYDLAK